MAAQLHEQAQEIIAKHSPAQLLTVAVLGIFTFIGMVAGWTQKLVWHGLGGGVVWCWLAIRYGYTKTAVKPTVLPPTTPGTYASGDVVMYSGNDAKRK
jgi:hypothetical protein